MKTISVLDGWTVTHSLPPRGAARCITVARQDEVLMTFEVSDQGFFRMVELLSPCCNDTVFVMGALMRTTAGPTCSECRSEVYRPALTVDDRDDILSRWSSPGDLRRFLERILSPISDPLVAVLLVDAVFHGCVFLQSWGNEEA